MRQKWFAGNKRRNTETVVYVNTHESKWIVGEEARRDSANFGVARACWRLFHAYATSHRMHSSRVRKRHSYEHARISDAMNQNPQRVRISSIPPSEWQNDAIILHCRGLDKQYFSDDRTKIQVENSTYTFWSISLASTTVCKYNFLICLKLANKIELLMSEIRRNEKSRGKYEINFIRVINQDGWYLKRQSFIRALKRRTEMRQREKERKEYRRGIECVEVEKESTNRAKVDDASID